MKVERRSSRGSNYGRENRFILSKVSRPTRKPAQPGVKRLGCGSKQRPPSRFKVQSAWSYTAYVQVVKRNKTHGEVYFAQFPLFMLLCVSSLDTCSSEAAFSRAICFHSYFYVSGPVCLFLFWYFICPCAGPCGRAV